jgi:hypothetical protein
VECDSDWRVVVRSGYLSCRVFSTRRTVLVSALKLDLLTTRFVSGRSHPPDMAVPLGLQSRESGWSREEDDVGAVLDGGNWRGGGNRVRCAICWLAGGSKQRRGW